ncbi:MAG: energy-coupling factor transporter ATP-binding protein EcfA2 [Flavobacterium sp.]|jgi:energy-coupling factor transporter ATP-binding protein EcfA2
MNNNDVLKKLRVALQLRDDQIMEILELVDFRISKGEIGNLFRAEDHKDFILCGDQILRNFLNGLIIHLRGTKEEPKNPIDVLAANKIALDKPKEFIKKEPAKDFKKPTTTGKKFNYKEKEKDKKKAKIEIVEKVKFNNGKAKK